MIVLKNRILKYLCMVAIITALIATVSFGDVYARYLSTGYGDVGFNLCITTVSVADTESGEVVSAPQWTGNKSVFTVSLDENDVNSENENGVYVRIRLYVKNTLYDSTYGDLTVTLKCSDTQGGDAEKIAAVSRKLDSTSVLAKKSGDGWIYTFEDSQHNEQVYCLEKGQTTSLYFQMEVSGKTVSADMFEIKTEVVDSY